MFFCQQFGCHIAIRYIYDLLSAMHFDRRYFIATIALFVIEVLIALYVRDNFIRPYFGDVLVVILIYCFVKSFFRFDAWKTAVGVLLFAYFIEWTQYQHLIVLLGWQDFKFAKVVLGYSFAWHDMLAYTVGVAAIIVTENLNRRNRKPSIS